jgi:U4/U6 small nuclear ribonucleoprotein PRP4
MVLSSPPGTPSAISTPIALLDSRSLPFSGLDAIGRVWDARTGRTAMVLDGHVQSILGLDFSPNGYQLATGSGDDTIRIWDMRASKALYTIPAHTSNVADVRFYKNDEMYSSKPEVEVDGLLEGEDVDVNMADESGDSTPSKPSVDSEEWRLRSGMYLASGGYDGLVKLWSADDWNLLKTFPTDSGKVMSVDLSPDARLLASGTYMRNFQLFAPEEVPVA